MAIPIKVLTEIVNLLTSDRISYRGSEIPLLNEILKVIQQEQIAAVQALRVVPVEPKEATRD